MIERELHLPRALLLFVMSSLLFDVGYYFGTSFASIFRIHRSHAFVAIRIYLAHTANAMHAISGWNPVKPKWIPGQAATVGIDTLSNNNI